MYNFRGRLGFLHLAEQLTGLFMKFGGVHSAKIKENNCYGFVTFEKRECAEAALSAGKQPDGIELLNGKQVYISWALGSLPEWKKGIGGRRHACTEKPVGGIANVTPFFHQVSHETAYYNLFERFFKSVRRNDQWPCTVVTNGNNVQNVNNLFMLYSSISQDRKSVV